MISPDARLADARWRVRNSVYLLAALSFGFVFAGFLYTGIRSRTRAWIVWGIAYAVVFALAFAMIEIAGGSPDEVTGTRAVMARVGAVLYLVQWVGGGIHLGFQRRSWLRWKAQAEPVPWYAQTATPSPAFAGETAITPLGMAAPVNDYLAPLPPVRAQIDLNTATPDEIAHLPGVGIATATRLVSERDQRGGFETLAEAIAAAQLDASTEDRLTGAVWVSRRLPQAPGGAGRVVDL